eukprot:GHVS01017811.1.p1 GENE.GHVS01017811.1~~GHVS01017811.1.p1  ORF type:complete len:621 (+),score=122.71 GHVS01017811.1:45-1907(+)
MGSSILEALRVFHEDIEQNSAAVSLLLQYKYDPASLTSTSSSTDIVEASSIPNPAAPSLASSYVAPYHIPTGTYYDICCANLLKRMQSSANSSLKIYADEDAVRKEEIAFLAGNPSDEGDTSNSGDVWTNFYDRVKAVKDYHRKFGSHLNVVGSGSTDARTATSLVYEARTNANECMVKNNVFSVEERGGRRMELIDEYNHFVNVKSIKQFKQDRHKLGEKARLRKKLTLMAARKSKEGSEEAEDGGGKGDEDTGVVTKDMSFEEASAKVSGKLSEAAIEALMEDYQEIDYITYLKTFSNFSEIPRSCKYGNTDYVIYMNCLLRKLKDFFHRTHPLAPLPKMLEKFSAEFETAWAGGELKQWQDPPTHQEPMYAVYTDKLFNAQGRFQAHINGKKYKKLEKETSEARGILGHSELVDRSLIRDKELAKQEFIIGKFDTVLKQFLHNTVCHLQKKQSRSAKELEQEVEEEEEIGAMGEVEVEEEEDEEQEDDEDKPIYNPLNLPLGWDGKPIPFWLYKLHGLGVEYKCEICGNYSYWGRRAFEKHFQEWRHAMGMRCLKIPNTTHFKEITKIEDAITLYEKLKKEAEIQAFKFDQEVECEDSQGNVMSARAYDDLRRQGLL